MWEPNRFSRTSTRPPATHRGNRGRALTGPRVRSSSWTRAACRSICLPSAAVRSCTVCCSSRMRHAGPVRRTGATRGAGADVTAWSFHPRKVLTTGEGGMLTTTRRVGRRARPARTRHGRLRGRTPRRRPGTGREYAEVGFNFRMTDLQAAVGLVQLGRLREMVARRRRCCRLPPALDRVPGLATGCGSRLRDVELPVLLGRGPAGVPPRPRRPAGAPGQRWISARRGIMAAHRQPAYAPGSRPRATCRSPSD